MPRKLRLEYSGAIYHLINRGDRREPIFKDDTDRRSFLELLAQGCARTGWQVHAFVLMPNHFHFGEELRESAEAKAQRLDRARVASGGV